MCENMRKSKSYCEVFPFHARTSRFSEALQLVRFDFKDSEDFIQNGERGSSHPIPISLRGKPPFCKKYKYDSEICSVVFWEPSGFRYYALPVKLKFSSWSLKLPDRIKSINTSELRIKSSVYWRSNRKSCIPSRFSLKNLWAFGFLFISNFSMASIWHEYFKARLPR